ncbi:AraC family transcriptional regulator [Andreprevotia chitinilytica]|uniref:AraC family transcriptional regulator n=1 Tax=Andreprevotia chitinilytica TaxID=396808 RepID=UPI000552C9AA|nr:AraC family transcriptional regulator [Andreprevotia chitinilytica]
MLTSLIQAEQGDRSAEQLQITVMRARLAAQIERHTGSDGVHGTAVPGLFFGRATRAQHPAHTIYQPTCCILAQGSKRVFLNDDVYVYDGSRYLVVSQNLPVSTQHIGASPETPVLGMRIDFETKDIAAAVLEMCGAERLASRKVQRGMFTGDLTPTLLDAVLRLVYLVDTPDDIPALAPLYVREILYRLLRGPDGWRLAQMALSENHSLSMARAISWLHAHFHEPLVVEELAREVYMSVSSLHGHFKAVTAMSPLQFQKQLRLQEARRIMLSEGVDAGTAGHRVGYESQSQFNREYSRFFGAPPARDVKRLREDQSSVS